ncbi:hypothetical protein PGUG_01471 [Meyerozyma guilliermondii ATCC 6260]|uniref:Uncharacterized protein n=1 Tax=Meyerozyma guilliermondii (strain ATCC 6260 / CBS 566 / DSM 6381 / JCM 1539 / NBRC 10279 / NRRL Y-324) TaxID=294746 RepID=A5DDX0_PICGU|nr:uncharacterized protein PGUG_01471 [Meyerozyma guilliermondii ATCC 6260]EDK37374.2 hypothetical protein PGUG_01471 [Meyerozyma guilliermondii ATCC 6260]
MLWHNRHRRATRNNSQQVIPATFNTSTVFLQQLFQRYGHLFFDGTWLIDVAQKYRTTWFPSFFHDQTTQTTHLLFYKWWVQRPPSRHWSRSKVYQTNPRQQGMEASIWACRLYPRETRSTRFLHHKRRLPYLYGCRRQSRNSSHRRFCPRVPPCMPR